MIDYGDLPKPPAPPLTADRRPAFPAVDLVDTARNIALQPETFRNLCSGTVQPAIDFIERTYVRQATSKQNGQPYYSVVVEIQHYLDRMSSQIQAEFYRDFANERGGNFLREVTISGKKYTGFVPISELNETQMAEWYNYVNSSTEFIGRARPTLVRAFQTQAFPTVTTKYRKQDVPLAQSLRDVNHHIVLQLLPNISDGEAKAIFGSTYTAEAVHRTPSPELFIWR